MKGPGMRIELDVSRIWRCPACHRTVGTRGTETARRCFCGGTGTWMELVEPIRRPRDFSAVISEIHQGLESDGTSAEEPATGESAAEETPAAETAAEHPAAELPAEDSFGSGIAPEQSAAAAPDAPSIPAAPAEYVAPDAPDEEEQEDRPAPDVRPDGPTADLPEVSGGDSSAAPGESSAGGIST